MLRLRNEGDICCGVKSGGNWQDYLLGVYGIYVGRQITYRWKGTDYYYNFVDDYILNNDKDNHLDFIEELKDAQYIDDKLYNFYKSRIVNVECDHDSNYLY